MREAWLDCNRDKYGVIIHPETGTPICDASRQMAFLAALTPDRRVFFEGATGRAYLPSAVPPGARGMVCYIRPPEKWTMTAQEWKWLAIIALAILLLIILAPLYFPDRPKCGLPGVECGPVDDLPGQPAG